MISACKAAFKNMFSLKGHLKKRPFWLFFLDYSLYWLIVFAITFFIVNFGFDFRYTETLYILVLVMMFLSAPLVMGLSTAMVRRMHDANLSGWWYWLWLIPVLGWILLILILLLPSVAANNKYTEKPDFHWQTHWWTWVVLVILGLAIIQVFPVLVQLAEFVAFLFIRH